MKKFKSIIALVLSVALMLVLTACQNKAPETYNFAKAGITLDSLTKVVGDRSYSGTTESGEDGSIDSLEISYTGVSKPTDDMQSYAAYLCTQGFLDYYGVDGVQMCLAKREGDGATIATASVDGDKLTIKFEWKQTLNLSFGETQYVSGNSLAILPNPELVVFDYPVLGDAVAAQDTVNQQILDGVNDVIQYAKDIAAGSDFKLIGDYNVDSSLVSDVRITFTGELTIGESTQHMSMTMTINDILNSPVAEYSEITVE